MATLASCVSCGIVADGNVLSVNTGDPEWPYTNCSLETAGAPLYCDPDGRIAVDPSPRLPFYITASGSITYNQSVPDSLSIALYQPVVIPNPSPCLPCVIDFIWSNETSWDIAAGDRVYVYLSTALDFSGVERYVNYVNGGTDQQTNTGWTLGRRETVILQPGESYEANLAVSVSATSSATQLRRIEFVMRGTCTVIQTA